MKISFVQLKKYKNELAAGALLFFSFISSVFVFESNQSLAQQWKNRREKDQEIQKLIDLSIQYPDSRDLLYRLGIAQWEIGNNQAAKDALNRAQYVDPNNPIAKSLQNF